LPSSPNVGSRERHAVVLFRIHIDCLTGRRAARVEPETINV
jgi:hypothetical protein